MVNRQSSSIFSTCLLKSSERSTDSGAFDDIRQLKTRPRTQVQDMDPAAGAITNPYVTVEINSRRSNPHQQLGLPIRGLGDWKTGPSS